MGRDVVGSSCGGKRGGCAAGRRKGYLFHWKVHRSHQPAQKGKGGQHFYPYMTKNSCQSSRGGKTKRGGVKKGRTQQEALAVCGRGEWRVESMTKIAF